MITKEEIIDICKYIKANFKSVDQYYTVKNISHHIHMINSIINNPDYEINEIIPLGNNYKIVDKYDKHWSLEYKLINHIQLLMKINQFLKQV